jgi:mercuric reductase
MAKHKFDYDIIVIGSGAGGGVAADIAAKKGKRVAIIESDKFGGEYPHTGCVPVGALLQAAHSLDDARDAAHFGIRSSTIGFNYPTIKAWKDSAIKRTGVENTARYYQSQGISLFHGDAHFLSPHEITVNRRHLSAEQFLVATGSSLDIPEIDGLPTIPYLDAVTALDVTKPPKSLFIVGAGDTGCEYAELFSIFGTKVYIADMAPRILPRYDEEVSRHVHEMFEEVRGIHTLDKAKVISVKKEGLSVRVTLMRGGEHYSVRVDSILIATGKHPRVDIGLENAGVTYTPKGIVVNEFLQTHARHIYAAGDVLGHHMLTHTGIQESRIAAHNLTEKTKASPDYTAVPRVTYLSPEVATTGMTEADCLKRDLDIKTSTVPISTVTRSNVSNQRDGFCKVITDKKGVIIGGTVVAPRAGEIIHELTLAVQYKLTAADLAATMHAYPTWSEIVRVACAKIKV